MMKEALKQTAIALEGVSGVGKTTLCNNLAKESDFTVIPEWTNLPDYSFRAEKAKLPPLTIDDARKGIDFFLSLENERVRCLNDEESKILIVDKTPAAIIAVEYALLRHGFPSDIKYLLERYSDTIRNNQSFPISGFIYLHYSSEAIFRTRAKVKAATQRDFFKSWNIIDKMQQGYEDFFSCIPPHRLLKINAEESLENSMVEVLKFIKSIVQDDRPFSLTDSLEEMAKKYSIST